MIGDDDDGNSKVSCKVQKHFHGILDYWSNLNHFGYDYHSGGDHSVMENKNIFTQTKVDFNSKLANYLMLFS